MLAVPNDDAGPIFSRVILILVAKIFFSYLGAVIMLYDLNCFVWITKIPEFSDVIVADHVSISVNHIAFIFHQVRAQKA